jgi:hypothetical protein
MKISEKERKGERGRNREKRARKKEHEERGRRERKKRGKEERESTFGNEWVTAEFVDDQESAHMMRSVMW